MKTARRGKRIGAYGLPTELLGIRKIGATPWQGWLDSNQRNNGVKGRCLTAWRHPYAGAVKNGSGIFPDPVFLNGVGDGT